MKADTRKRKLAALLGIEFKEPPTKQEIEDAGTVSREAEAVIAFGNRTQKFIQRECIQCGGVFAVNRSNIACCSDTCRQHHLLFKFGLEWNPTGRTLEDRWSVQTGGPEPLIVPPPVLPLVNFVSESQSVELPQQHELQSLDDLLDLSGIGEV